MEQQLRAIACVNAKRAVGCSAHEGICERTRIEAMLGEAVTTLLNVAIMFCLSLFGRKNAL